MQCMISDLCSAYQILSHRRAIPLVNERKREGEMNNTEIILMWEKSLQNIIDTLRTGLRPDVISNDVEWFSIKSHSVLRDTHTAFSSSFAVIEMPALSQMSPRQQQIQMLMCDIQNIFITIDTMASHVCNSQNTLSHYKHVHDPIMRLCFQGQNLIKEYYTLLQQ